VIKFSNSNAFSGYSWQLAGANVQEGAAVAAGFLPRLEAGLLAFHRYHPFELI
jgi:hypothetical protein